MDAVHELAEHELVEQSSDEMREEIDSTRSGLADKLDALEDRVMGTVQSAQETVEDSIQIAQDTMATVKRTFDIKHHVEQYPWAMVGGSFLAGLALGALFQRGRRPRQAADGRGGEKAGFSARPARTKQRDNGSFASAAPQYESPPPSRAGWLDLFHDEIAKVKGLAIGYVLELARGAIKDAAPKWAPQIDDMMNSVTTKLGGEPAPERGQ